MPTRVSPGVNRIDRLTGRIGDGAGVPYRRCGYGVGGVRYPISHTGLLSPFWRSGQPQKENSGERQDNGDNELKNVPCQRVPFFTVLYDIPLHFQK